MRQSYPKETFNESQRYALNARSRNPCQRIVNSGAGVASTEIPSRPRSTRLATANSHETRCAPVMGSNCCKGDAAGRPIRSSSSIYSRYLWLALVLAQEYRGVPWLLRPPAPCPYVVLCPVL